MISDDDYRKALADARDYLSLVEPHLPKKVSAAEIAVWSKAPYKAMVVRGGLLWRTQELASDAIEAFGDSRLATAIILTRAVIENVALHWRVGEMIARRENIPPNELSDTLTRMLVGWKCDADFPEALNVLTMIKHLDKQLPGLRHAYDQLSEIAHPNYGGVHGLYAENDEANFITSLGPNVRSNPPRHAVLILAATLGLQVNADVQFVEAVEAWIAELPGLDDPRPDDETWWKPARG